MTLNSRGFEDSQTSNWGLKPTVMLGGDLDELLGSCCMNDRDRVNLGQCGLLACSGLLYCTPVFVGLLIFVVEGLLIGRLVGCIVMPIFQKKSK